MANVCLLGIAYVGSIKLDGSEGPTSAVATFA